MNKYIMVEADYLFHIIEIYKDCPDILEALAHLMAGHIEEGLRRPELTDILEALAHLMAGTDEIFDYVANCRDIAFNNQEAVK